MKGFIKWTITMIGASIFFLIMGFVFIPSLLLVPVCIFIIPFYPLFKITMPEFMEKKGY